MKILHLISQHPESTGSGFYLQNIIRQAEKKGHDNFLVAGITRTEVPDLDCISPDSCRFVHFDYEELNFTIPGMSDVMPYPSSRFSALTAAQLETYEQVFSRTLTEAVYDFSPDIIHSHHLWIVSSIARRLFPDLPMVTSCHSTCLRQFVQCPHLRSRVTPCRDIDKILALSNDQKNSITKLFEIEGRKITVVGGGFNEALFHFTAKSEPPPVQVLYGGKLSYAKGVDWLLHTFNGLQDKGIHLNIAGSGSGEEERKCLELAAENSSGVTVHGRLSQQELAELMAFCHLFILPSFYEGLPLVLLEALACGCRIITTDLSGCRELLRSADHDLVEFITLPPLRTIDSPAPKDVPMLEKRLGKAIQDMAAKVRRSPSPNSEHIRQITARFGWGTVFTRIEEVYEKVISS